MASAGDRHTVLLRSDGKVAVAGSNVHGQCNLQKNLGGFKQVSAGGEHTLVLSKNGDVMAFGSNKEFQCALPKIRASSGGLEYVQVSAGHMHSVALRSDGKVLYAGKEYGGDEIRLVPMAIGMASEVCDAMTPNASCSKPRRSFGLVPNGRFAELGPEDTAEDNAIELEYSALEDPSQFIEPFDTSLYEEASFCEASSLWELRPSIMRFSGFFQNAAETETVEDLVEPKFYEISCGGVPIGHISPQPEVAVVEKQHGTSQVMTPPVSPRKFHAHDKAWKSPTKPEVCALSPRKSTGGSQPSSSARQQAISPRRTSRGRSSFGLVSPSRWNSLDEDEHVPLDDDGGIELEYGALNGSDTAQNQCNRGPQEFSLSEEELCALRNECAPAAAANYVQVSAGHSHTALLRSDGRVVAFGVNEAGQCNVPKEAEFDQVSAGGFHTVLLHKNGDAMALGSNSHQQCELPTHHASSPVRYVRVSAGRRHTVLLRNDGRVEAVGCNTDGQCQIPALEVGVKYVQASAGGHHTALLRSDGQAITVGAEGDISIPAVQKHQSWGDWLLTKPTLPDGVEYVSDSGELPVEISNSEDETVDV